VDYFCWKCKVKFGNAAAYISHSSSCFPPAATEASVNPSHSAGYANRNRVSNTNERLQEANRKRGRKNVPVTVVETKRQEFTTNEQKRRKTSGQPSKATMTTTVATPKGRKKQPSANSAVAVKVQQEPTVSPAVTMNGASSDKGVNTVGLACPHCSLKCPSSEKLFQHAQQCKTKRNPYDTYQYKCIKCSESFDIYLHYKRHIAVHTGEVRLS